jgi:hypothetical protein
MLIGDAAPRTFDSPADASAIVRQRQMALGSAQVLATLHPDFVPTPDQKQQLMSLIAAKYAAPFLDLSGLAAQGGVSFADFNDKGFVTAVCEIVSAHCRSVQTLRLDGNQIRTLAALRDLPEAAPLLLNLSLADNRIESLDELDHLHGYAPHLTELVMTGTKPKMPCGATNPRNVRWRYKTTNLFWRQGTRCRPGRPRLSRIWSAANSRPCAC